MIAARLARTQATHEPDGMDVFSFVDRSSILLPWLPLVLYLLRCTSCAQSILLDCAPSQRIRPIESTAILATHGYAAEQICLWTACLPPRLIPVRSPSDLHPTSDPAPPRRAIARFIESYCSIYSLLTAVSLRPIFRTPQGSRDTAEQYSNAPTKRNRRH